MSSKNRSGGRGRGRGRGEAPTGATPPASPSPSATPQDSPALSTPPASSSASSTPPRPKVRLVDWDSLAPPPPPVPSTQPAWGSPSPPQPVPLTQRTWRSPSPPQPVPPTQRTWRSPSPPQPVPPTQQAWGSSSRPWDPPALRASSSSSSVAPPESSTPTSVRIPTNLHYNMNTGIGYYSFSKDEEKPLHRQVHVDKIENKSRIIRYMNRMRGLVERAHPNILTPHECYLEEGLVLTELYTYTMLDVAEKEGKKWWVAPASSSSVRMSPQLQRVIRGISKGIEMLKTSETSFPVTLKSIVFCNQDAFLGTDDFSDAFEGRIPPKIYNTWDDEVDDHYDPNFMWKGLANSIEEMARISNISMDSEVKEFLKMLRRDHTTSLNADTVKRHPALLTSFGRLQLICAVRDTFSLRQQPMPFPQNDTRATAASDWSRKAQNDTQLKCVYDFKKAEYEKSTKYNQDLVTFIRDCTHHINDKNYKAKHNLGDLDDVGLDRKVNANFPDFYSYVFDSYIIYKPPEEPWIYDENWGAV